jgi:hypothetical protein
VDAWVGGVGLRKGGRTALNVDIVFWQFHGSGGSGMQESYVYVLNIIRQEGA